MEYKKLSEIAEITMGQSPDSNSYNENTDGLPFFQGKTDFGEVNPTIRMYCNAPKKIAEIDDILMSVRAPVGDINISNVKCCIGRGLCSIRISSEHDLKYIYYFIKTIKPQLDAASTGSTFKAINKNVVQDILVPVPDLPTQQKIANTLDKATELIEKRKTQITALDDLTQSIFHDMFGDPVSNEKNWEVKTLKSLSTKIMSGNTPKGGSQVYVKEGINFFRSQNVWRNEIKLEDIAYIDEKTHKTMSKSSLKHKDILVTKTGRINTENSSLGRSALYLGEDDSANLNGHVYLVRLKEGVSHEFVVHIIPSLRYREHIRAVCVGGIDKRQINKNHLEEFPIVFPPEKLQIKFIELTKKITSQKKLLQNSLTKMEENFNGLIKKTFEAK